MLLAVSHKTKNLDSKGENNAGDVERLLHPLPVPTDMHHMEVDLAALKKEHKKQQNSKTLVQELSTKKR